jgi:stage II sporulation protein D
VKVGNRDWFRGRDTLECAASGGALIAVNERTYRGSILAFVSAGGGLVVVNELGLEEYLYGVVPCEIGPISEETFEAVKAQAVAARSFALARAGKRRGSGFDLYDSYARDQEYRGAGYETGPGREAVDATREEVLLFQGEPADALYHANCGGVTVGSSLPYLRSARDSPGHRSGARPYCAWSRSHTWQVQLPRDSVERALSRLVRVERLALCGLSLRKDPVTGRVVDVNVRTRKGTYRVSGADLRTALRLRSPTFDVRLRGRAVEFAGRGYGHGCGMCQDGAVGMARSGRSYRQILQHYYPRLRLGRRR